MTRKRMIIHWIHTSDVHGHLDALQGIEQAVNALRARYGSDSLILTDGGDVLQGHPYVYYHNFINTRAPHAVAETMNRMGYDCMAVGNHDIETGHQVYDKVFAEFNFPTLCANVASTKYSTAGEGVKTSENCYFQPYYIIKRGGLNIAVLSLLTPDTEHWLSRSQYEGMEFQDSIATAKRWIAHIKQTEHVDLLVGLMHIGWTEAQHIVEEIPDFDLVLYGHDHHEGIHEIGKTLCAAPSALGTSYVKLEIDTETKHISAQLIKNNATPSPIHNTDYEAWLNTKIGSIDVDLNEFDSYFGPSYFLALVHQLQLRVTGAQISLAAPISYDAFIPAGPLTNRNIFTLYNRDSQLYTMRFTLDEIKGILEYSYSLWCNVMTSRDDHALLMDYLLDNGTRLCLKSFTINFLTAYGIGYTVDLTKPYGEKICMVEKVNKGNEGNKVNKGNEVNEGNKGNEVLACVNSFHANGGGEVLTKGTGLTYTELRQRIVKVESQDLRKCLAEEIKKVGNYHLKDTDNWRFIPEDWAEPALMRDRKILIN